MADKLDTSTLGPIRLEPAFLPVTRLDLLEYVNRLNMRAAAARNGKVYWTVTVMYNTVIYEQDQDGIAAMHEIFKGVL